LIDDAECFDQWSDAQRPMLSQPAFVSFTSMMDL